jgi:hypothetical protein
MLQRIGNFDTMLHYTSKDKKDETIFLPFYTLQQFCEFLSTGSEEQILCIKN